MTKLKLKYEAFKFYLVGNVPLSHYYYYVNLTTYPKLFGYSAMHDFTLANQAVITVGVLIGQ